MFQNDYLMRIIMQFVQALQRALRNRQASPTERAADLEQVIGDAVNIDPRLLLSTDPESVVSLLQLGDFDEQIGEYVLRSLYMEANLLDEAGQGELADLRRAQAGAIAEAYNLDVTAEDVDPEALEAFFAEQKA
ncbi:MAG TPA: hypothetical protein DEB24_05975 [Coriobacteriia bacterium]|nr:hypothetical protein [Coriobacteriia bacterium]